MEQEDHSILLAEKTLNSKDNRDKMTKMVFEIFNVPAMYIQI